MAAPVEFQRPESFSFSQIVAKSVARVPRNALGWEFDSSGMVIGPETVDQAVEEFVRHGNMDRCRVQNMSAYADVVTHAWPDAAAEMSCRDLVLPPDANAQAICNLAYVAIYAEVPKHRVWANGCLDLYLTQHRGDGWGFADCVVS